MSPLLNSNSATDIAGSIITQPLFFEPDCHDHFQPIFQHNDLCRASLGLVSLVHNRRTMKSAYMPRNDRSHEHKYVGDTTAGHTKTLGFSLLSEFSVDGMDPGPVISTASMMGQDGNLDHRH